MTAWLDRQVTLELHLTSISLAELLLGIASVPEGRRKEGLIEALSLLRRTISTCVLPFDEEASLAYSVLMARARRNGFALSAPDGQIAAIAEVHGCAVATRNVGPFQSAGIRVINPWDVA